MQCLRLIRPATESESGSDSATASQEVVSLPSPPTRYLSSTMECKAPGVLTVDNDPDQDEFLNELTPGPRSCEFVSGDASGPRPGCSHRRPTVTGYPLSKIIFPLHCLPAWYYEFDMERLNGVHAVNFGKAFPKINPESRV